jgi:hypothetical protein
MFFLRRAFLKSISTAAASAFAIPALLRARDLVSLSQTQESTMEIKRIGSQPSSRPAGLVYRNGPIDPFQANPPVGPMARAYL